MKFSITVLLVVQLIVASVADEKSKINEEKSLEEKLSSSFCRYGNIKHAEGAVKTFSKYCTEIKCEKKGKTLQWVFRKKEDCICNFPSTYKPIKANKNSAKCVFNRASGNKGKVLATFNDTCLALVCKASKKKIIITTQTIPKCVCQDNSSNWIYQNPNSWSSYNYFCGGSNQSPIDLISDISEDVSESPLVFTNFDVVPETMYTLNSGYIAEVNMSFTRDAYPTISGGGLDGNFIFQSLYFHWGSDSSQGSEHLIDGKTFPLEMQLILKNRNNLYPACYYTADGTAILGFMFEVSKEDNPAFNNMISLLKDIEELGSSAVSDVTQSLNSYIDVDKSKFFRYSGSLTSTLCFESVIWTVFKDPIPISENQLEAFRNTIKDGNGNFIKKNFRPVQPLNGRIIQNITT